MTTKTKKTFRDWVEFSNRMSQVEALDPSKPTYVNDKWTYCAKKNLERLAKELQKVQKVVKEDVDDYKENLLISLASTNDKGELLSGGFMGYSFKSETMKEYNQKSKNYERVETEKLYDTEIEFEFYKLTDENCARVKTWDKFTLEYFAEVIPASYMSEEIAENMGLKLVSN